MERILIVDDENSIRVTLCEFLKRRGQIADSASNAFEALQMIEENSYDVIVSDIIMPQLTGLQLLEKIRENSQTAQVLIMTGEPTVDSAVLSVKRGANDYLIKPIRKDDFLKSVDHALQIKRLSDAKHLLEEKNLRYQRELEEMVKIRTSELEKNMQGIVFLLSSVVEVRDPFTAGHQRRVGNLSAAIAELLGLDKKRVELIRVTGYIHDIGKIMIPTEILSKPGILNPIERKIIENHPSNGLEMLTRVNLPDVIGEIISQHHERYDGSGYPSGINGGEMRIEPQILGVADVIEAMTSHRPYRPALELSAALAEIKAFSGRSYHPEVVDACIQLFHEKNYTIDQSEYEVFFPL